jgi:hypothetical protein
MAADEITSLSLDRHLTAAGAPAASFARLWRGLWAQPYVSAELLELCRLTLARLHRDEAELAAPNPHAPLPAASGERRAVVLSGGAERSTLFSDGERAILAFTETYGLDPQSLTDAQAAQVGQQLGEPGLVFLIEALGCLDARIRTARVLRDLVRHGAQLDG